MRGCNPGPPELSQLCYQVSCHNSSVSLPCHHGARHSEAQTMHLSCPHSPPQNPLSYWHHLSLGKWESGEGSDWLPRWYVGAKYLPFPCTNLVRFSCKSLLPCWQQRQLHVCHYVLEEAKKLLFKAFNPGLPWVTRAWCLWLIFAQCFVIYNFRIHLIHGTNPWDAMISLYIRESRGLIHCPRSQLNSDILVPNFLKMKMRKSLHYTRHWNYETEQDHMVLVLTGL